MEAQVQGSKQQAEEGTLVLLAAGDRSLFDDCQSCFQAVGKNSFYLGRWPDVGRSSVQLPLARWYERGCNGMSSWLAMSLRVHASAARLSIRLEVSPSHVLSQRNTVKSGRIIPRDLHLSFEHKNSFADISV